MYIAKNARYQLKHAIRILILISIGYFCLFPSILNAGGPPPPPPKGGDVPIDGGIVLLLAAGIAYGGKKIFDTHRRKAK